MNPVAVSPRRLLIDGALIGTAFGAVVVVSLRIDRRLWLDDYPPDVRAAVGEVGQVSGILTAIVAVLLLVTLLGGFLASNRWLARDLGARFDFPAAFLHTFGLMLMVNAWDVVVIDWLFFVALQPAFVIFPGTEGLAGYTDYGYHFRESFLNPRAWTGMLVASVVVAVLAHRLWRRTGPEPG